ncbi:hypothetical protein TgHK011_001566 [Trichoderma gracile]|nr:hypothetical protein TgHK011_001566 [Trichoderma gracile]
MSGKYKEVLGLLIKGPIAALRARVGAADEGVEVDANEAADDAIAFFRSISNFLISYGTHIDAMFDILQLACRQIAEYGYNALEELCLCAVEFFRDRPIYRLQHDQFNGTAGILEWVAEKSGLDLHITKAIIKASTEGRFEGSMLRLLAHKSNSVEIDSDAAAELLHIYHHGLYEGEYVSFVMELILLYRGGRFRHDKVVMDAFKTRLICPKHLPRDSWLHCILSAKYANFKFFATNLLPEFHVKSLRLLLAYGADIEEKGLAGETVLMRACLMNNRRLSAFFLSYGANSNIRRISGDGIDRSLICEMVWRGHHDLLELLLACGANPNVTSGEDANPPLIEAVCSNDVGLIRSLLRFGADATARNNQNRDAGDFACSDAIKKLLQKYSPPSRPCVTSIRPRVWRFMREYGLFPKPNGWSLGRGNLWHVRGLDHRLHVRWRNRRRKHIG